MIRGKWQDREFTSEFAMYKATYRRLSRGFWKIDRYDLVNGIYTAQQPCYARNEREARLKARYPELR